jgi:predicted amidohydrolase YtcJ
MVLMPSFEEKTKGSIEPGKLADLVVWEATAARRSHVADQHLVERTMVGGRWVFEAGVLSHEY